MEVIKDPSILVNGAIPNFDTLNQLIKRGSGNLLRSLYLHFSSLRKVVHSMNSFAGIFAHDFAKGHDNYPTNWQAALRLLESFHVPKLAGTSQGTAFAQQGKKKKDDKFKLICHYCNKPGHIKPDCKKFKAAKKVEEKAPTVALTTKSDSSVSSKSSKTKMEAVIKRATDNMAGTILACLAETANEDLTDNEASSNAHFQFGSNFHQHVSQDDTKNMPKFSKAYLNAENVHKQSKHGTAIDLKYVILLDNQSIVDPTGSVSSSISM
jgi:Zinc knuckle